MYLLRVGTAYLCVLPKVRGWCPTHSTQFATKWREIKKAEQARARFVLENTQLADMVEIIKEESL